MFKPLHILLVDDDEDDQWLFKKALNEIDGTINVDVAGNGLEALATLHKVAALPNIIFMDVNMPYMNGLECLRKIKATTRFKNIPVILLTTTSSVKEQQTAAAAGAASFLTKPPVYDQLKQRISILLQDSF